MTDPPHNTDQGRRRSRHPVVVTSVLVLVLVAAAVVADRQYRTILGEQARTEATRTVRSYSATLELAVAEYAVMVEALGAWMRQYPDASNAEFLRFAGNLSLTTPPILALNRVRGTFITDVYPVERNRPAQGLNLETHTQPASYQGMLRAAGSGRVAIAGPIPLAQGGLGLIFFRTGGTDSQGLSSAAEVVVSMDAMLDGTGLEAVGEEYHLLISAADGTPIFGEPIDPALEPVSVVASLAEGTWNVSAVPHSGWTAAISGPVGAFRVILFGFVILLGLIIWGLVDRDHRLTVAVTQRTAALTETNQELEAVKELRQAAMSAGRVDVWSWDLRTDLIERAGSHAIEFGTPQDEPLSAFLDRVHPEDRALLESRVAEARATGILTGEFRERVQDNRWLWLRIEGRGVDFDDGRPTRIIGARADISALKELESELLHHGRLELIGQLAGGVVHDINNALAVVLGELDVALEDDGRYPVREAAQEAKSAAQYASVLTAQLLTFARKDRVEPTVFVWDEVCSESTSFIRRVLGASVMLDVDLAAGGTSVRMDRTHAMQVLANLATNARDSMSGKGRVRISTRTVDDGSLIAPEAQPRPAVVTEVSDSGIGIPSDVEDRVFEAFFTTKGRDRGTGLGLSNTRRIVRDAGGDVVFESTAQGTTFVVVIPSA